MAEATIERFVELAILLYERGGGSAERLLALESYDPRWLG